MQVVLATDGSQQAVIAGAQGLALLSADLVVIACVVDAPAVATAGLESGFAGGLASPEEIDEAWVGVNAEATEAIERTASALPATTSFEQVIIEGDPGSLICQLADERSADAIVVGSRGRGAIKRALLGSVSTYVVNNAPCPVIVVPASTEA